MRKLIVCFTVFIFSSGYSHCQSLARTKLLKHFHSINAVSILAGSSDNGLLVTTINGFQFQKTFIGIGLGYDNYNFKSVPLFIDARYNIFGKKNKIQLVANAGINFPFSKQQTIDKINPVTYSPGLFCEAGIEYRIPAKKHAAIVGLVQSFKQVKAVGNYVLIPTIGELIVPIHYNYRFARLAIRVGWEF